jgi:hypothetical protein
VPREIPRQRQADHPSANDQDIVHLGAVGRDDSPQEHRVNAAAKANLPVDFHDGDALVEPLAERGIAVNIDPLGGQTLPLELGQGFVAQVASRTGVKDYVEHEEFKSIVASISG